MVLSLEGAPSARRLRLLGLVSVPLSTALSTLSLFIPAYTPSVTSVLFASLLCHAVQAASVLMTRSVAGLVSLTSLFSTMLLIGLERRIFTLLIRSIYNAASGFGPKASADGSVSWPNKLIALFVSLLLSHIVVLCVALTHMLSAWYVRTKYTGTSFSQSFRLIGMACALWLSFVFLPSMFGNFSIPDRVY